MADSDSETQHFIGHDGQKSPSGATLAQFTRPASSPKSHSEHNSSTDNSDNGDRSGFLLRTFLKLTSPFSWVLSGFSKILPKTNKKTSLLSIYVALVIIFFVPSILYMDETIWRLAKNEYEVTSEMSLRKLQKIHTDRLADIVLPPRQNLVDESQEGYLFDPRLSVAVWLKKLQYHLMQNDGILDPEFQIPFSWYDWVDLPSKLVANPEFTKKWLSEHSDYSVKDFSSMNCEQFKDLFSGEDSILEFCRDMPLQERHQLPHYPHKFKIINRSPNNLEDPGRVMFGASYLATTAAPPARVHFLGAGLNKSSVVVLTERDPDNFTPYIEKRTGELIPMLNEVLKEEARLQGTSMEAVYRKGFRIEDIVDQVANLYSQNLKEQNYLSEEEIAFDKSYLLKLDEQVNLMTSFELTEKDFMWNNEDQMNAIQQRLDDTIHQYPNISKEVMFDHQLLQGIQTAMDVYKQNNNFFPPYLREAYVKDTHKGAHFDWRFFNGIEHPENYKKAVIHRIGRAWLRFCYQTGLRTFVAYGSMLGWIRNGLTLPWDEDIDVVVTMDSLYKLARNHNQTLIVDVSDEDKYAAGIGSYFLDIGSSWFTRIRGGGANAIDGRMIDTMSGVYIDITAVAWTENYFEQHDIDDTIKRIIDPEYTDRREKVEDRDAYENQMRDKANELQNKKQLYHCRNDNPYSLEELTPMVPTYFEGVRTHMPHAFEKLLRRKYPGALDRDTEPGHTYKKKLRLWVSDADCPGDDREGELCKDDEVIEEFLHTKEYTANHLRQFGNITHNQLSIDTETIPMRYDQFTVRYAQLLNARLE